jgi:hypothetical protein
MAVSPPWKPPKSRVICIWMGLQKGVLYIYPPNGRFNKTNDVQPSNCWVFPQMFRYQTHFVGFSLQVSGAKTYMCMICLASWLQVTTPASPQPLHGGGYSGCDRRFFRCLCTGTVRPQGCGRRRRCGLCGEPAKLRDWTQKTWDSNGSWWIMVVNDGS